jgi:NitT/TauT family transport system ATP-binding protein
MRQRNHLLELRQVTQTYRSGERQFIALQNVNLSLGEGEFVCLLGPSGCGKSTLLRIITGLQRPSEGEVLYRGRPLQGVNPHATIVFQSFALFPWLTVLENVELAMRARRVPTKLGIARALNLIDRVGLDGFETAYPRELSGGMRQKVGFARAMAVEPELLCLDEPFSALDVLSADALRGELLELWTEGKIPTLAVLMVTHNIEEAVFMADRIVLMEKEPGRIASELEVALPHPRQRKSASFLEMLDHVYATMAGQTQPEHLELGTAPGEPGRTRALPHIAVDHLLAGLLEHVGETPGNRHDIYRVAQELKMDSDHLLRLTDAAELLGFAMIAQGDISLTPLGETFAEASILSRKEIFGTRVRRLPIFRWLVTMLRAAEGQRLKKDVVQTALELEFPTDEAARQLETIIDWGRYAELIAYEDRSEVLYLDPGSLTMTTASQSGAN